MKLSMEDIKRRGFFPVVLQFIKFGIVGASNTLISLIFQYAFIWLDGRQAQPLLFPDELIYLGQVLGFLVSVLNAYYWNNRYVFGTGGWDWKKLFKSYVAYGGTALLSMALTYVELNWLHLNEYLVPILNLCITIPLNFITHRLWVYKKEGPAAEQAAEEPHETKAQ